MTDTTGRVDRTARLRWVPIARMSVSPLAQRELNPARVDRIAANFDLEQIGAPAVSARDGAFYIIDGQHRVEALRRIGYGDQQIQCWCYEGLTEADEADMFLKLNDYLAVNALAKFRVAVTAGRPVETDIDRVVRALGLSVTRDKIDGAIGAVGTLVRVYDRAGPAVLSRALRIIRDAYGTPGFESVVIDGMGFVCQRYNGELEEANVVTRLGNVHGGVKGLVGRAETLRLKTGNTQGHCVAATIVDICNSGRGGRKVTPWFKDQP